MKRKYELPSIEMVRLVTEDIIVTSTGNKLQSGQWSESTEGSTDFDQWLK